MAIKRKENGQFARGTHWRDHKAWWDREWLVNQYAALGKAAMQIANECAVTENAILYWMKKHRIQTRNMAEVRQNKHWGAKGEKNPMWGKFGKDNPRWRGGITPERQDFYLTREWKSACSSVWKRDGAQCVRCGVKSKDAKMHVHHIVPFENRELRAVVSNLVLLCASCHRFVHSKRNKDAEYIQQA